MFQHSELSASHGHSSLPAVLIYSITGEKNYLQKCLKECRFSRDQYGRNALFYSAMGDQPECMEVLLKGKLAVNSVDFFGRTALHWAASKNSHRCVKLLLAHSINWTVIDKEGVTALHLASHHSSSKCMDLILKYVKPEEIDVQDGKKRTALHWSSSSGSLTNIKLLIKKKSNIRVPDAEGKIPTHAAVSSGKAMTVLAIRALLEKSPTALNWQDTLGRSALHVAIADGTIDVVKELATKEICNLNSTDNLFRTPLHIAAMLGLTDIVTLLLDLGANKFCTDFYGATPLHYAVFSNHVNVIRVLVSKCLCVDVVDENGCTPLMWAAAKSDNSVVEALIQCGADLRAVNAHGINSLHIAASAGRVETMTILLRGGAMIDSTDVLGHSPLFHACEMGHLSSVVFLLKHGASLAPVDFEGRTALHWAALSGHKNICETLITFGMEPNACDVSGRTPLIYGTFGGNYYCLPSLVEMGANPHHADNQGMTALHWACKQGCLDGTEFLVNCNVDPNGLSIMETGNDRCTTLDLALIGGHLEIAQFIVKHGGISVVNVKNLAATKIQAYFRGYRIRKLLEVSILFDSFHLLTSGANTKTFDRYHVNDAVTESSRRNNKVTGRSSNVVSSGHCTSESSDATSYGLESKGGSADDECSSSRERSSSSDADGEATLFRHLERVSNLVKSVRVHRKSFHNSGSRIFASQFLKGSMDTLVVPLKSCDERGSSVSLTSFSRLSAAATSLQKSCSRHRSLIQLSEQLTPKNYLFGRLLRRKSDQSTVDTDRRFGALSDTSIGRISLDHSFRRSGRQRHYSENECLSKGFAAALKSHEALQMSFSSSTSTEDSFYATSTFEIPQWCADRALCKVAENEWSEALMNITFKRVFLNVGTL